MAYSGYSQHQAPINIHDQSDDEGDLGHADIEGDYPLRSGQSPFADTAYSRYTPSPDVYSEVPGYQAGSYELKETSTVNEYEDKQYAFLEGEYDPDAAFNERQQPLKRGHTRRVKLVNGDIFCTEYP